MYTVVSLNVDLAGEPNTIDFTLALFDQSCYCFIHLCELSRSVLTLTRDREGINRDLCVFFLRCAARRRCPPFFCLPPFLLSRRAPVQGTLPCTAPCLPQRIFQTRMITALNRGRRHRHPAILYPGTCPDTSVPRGKSTEGLCWTPRREPCSGSQVSSCVPVVPFSRTLTKYDLGEASYGESFRLPINPHHYIVTEFAWYPVSWCV